MKNIYPCLIAVAVGFLPVVSFAEGVSGNQDWAEKAAVEYERKAAAAVEEGNREDALIYTKMAKIKRDAGAAAKEGKSFSWDEYHALSGQLKGASKSSDHENKGEKGVENPADGFIKTAQTYMEKSIEAMKAGDTEKATIYMDLSKIKLDAASAVRQGKNFDWTQYHELVKRLEK